MTHRTHKKSGNAFSKLMRTSALTAIGLAAFSMPLYAGEGPVGDYDVMILENTAPSESSQGYVAYSNSNKIIDNATQEDVGRLGHTHFNTPLAVITGVEQGTMKIYGKVSATGSLYLYDVNGFLFGEGSSVDVVGNFGAFAGSGTVTENGNDLKITVDVAPDAGIQIEENASISVGQAGLAAFVAPTIVNNGVIKAKLGKVAFASGEKVTLDLYGDDLLEIEVTGESSKALIDNQGEILAEGGEIHITAAAAKYAVDNIINLDGVVSASSATMKGGKIVLSGGNATVKVAGKVEASGATGGGSIAVKSENIIVEQSAVIDASGTDHGDGGDIVILANQNAIFRGRAKAQGGANGGDGGFVEISAKNEVGYDGSVNTMALNGVAGSFLLDPLYAVIHSGSLNNTNFISAQSLANDLYTNSLVTVQADNYIDVGTSVVGAGIGNGLINVSSVTITTPASGGTQYLPTDNAGNILSTSSPGYNGKLNGCNSGSPGANCAINPSYIAAGTQNFLTNGNLKLQSSAINFNKDLILGNGDLIIDATSVNLGSKIKASNGTTLLGDARLSSNASTVNVIANAASIQQGVYLANDAGGATVNVGDGTYTENVSINKTLKLVSKNGRDATTINGISGIGALGTITITPNVGGVQIGDYALNSNSGLTINGIDNDLAGIENSGIYMQGAHDGTVIKGNRVVAQGDEALTTEYGHINSNMIVDGNIITGNTYKGLTYSTGDQFTDPNVARQLIAFNNGITYLTFINNDISGNSGHQHLVAIEADGALVDNNTVHGTTSNADIRVMGNNITVSKNHVTGTSNSTGIRVFDTNMVISGNTIDGTAQSGIEAFGAEGIRITGNTISGTIEDSIHVEDSNNAEIGGANDAEGNIISNGGGNGIYTYKSNNALIARNLVTNTVLNNIWADLSSNVTINNNETSGTAAHTGIALRNITGANIHNNIVQNAGYGLYADQNTTDVTAYDNSVSNIANYLVWNNGTPGTFNASRNWWGTTDAAAIAAKMSGSVDFSPYLASGLDLSAERGFQTNYDAYFVTTLGAQTSGLIQEAIDASDVDATVTVNAGAYTENLMVDVKGLKLKGLNGTTLNYDAANSGRGVAGNLITITATDVNIDPIAFDGLGLANFGINATGAHNLIVDGSSFTGFVDASINVANSNNVSIFDNTITGGKEGIAGNAVINAKIFDNIINGTTLNGIHVANSNGTGYNGAGNDVDIWGNTVATTSGTGIFVEKSNFATIGADSLNPFASGYAGGNKVSGGNAGIIVKNSNNAQVIYSTIDSVNGNGIEINGGTNVKVTTNKIGTTGGAQNIRGDGIFAINTDGVLIQSNKVERTHSVAGGKGTGIHVQNSDNAIIGGAGALGNIVNNSGWDGISVEGGDNVSINNNKVTKSARAGIFAKDLTNSNIINNTVDGTAQFRGISIKDGNVINVSGNTVDNTKLDGIIANGVRGLSINANFIGTNGTIGANGIAVLSSNGAMVTNNTISAANLDGINLKSSKTITASGNVISNVGDDGIDAVSIGTLRLLNNRIFKTGDDGIQVSLSDVSFVDGNSIAFTQGDGIDVNQGFTTEIQNNILGHIGYNVDANGINVSGTDHVVVKYNGIADVTNDGINVSDAGYVGIFGNNVLLSGGDGIEVSNVHPQGFNLSLLSADIDYPTVGYAVSMENNDVVLSGENGIYVHNADSTRIVANDVQFAGVGESIVSYVNEIGAFIFGAPSFAAFAAKESEITPSFDIEWGNGDGIKVDNVYRDNYFGPVFLSAGSVINNPTPYPQGDWTVLVQGNDVKWTGGDGIEVSNAGTTLIGGDAESEYNHVYQAGIDSTTFEGFDNFTDWAGQGPFADEAERRIVWWGSDLSAALESYMLADLVSITHDGHDGIKATNISNFGGFGPVGEAGNADNTPTEENPKPKPLYYGYALNILGNTVSTTGDDGIEAGNTSSALIMGNTVMGAGVGGYNGAGLMMVDNDAKVNYMSGDYYGADGITAHNIGGERRLSAGSYIGDYEEYALVIDGNMIDGAADDGIEVRNAGRTVMTGNTINKVGVYGNGYTDYGYINTGSTAGDGYGSDGIHARDVINHVYSYDPELGSYAQGRSYALDINNNAIDRTGDDGIEVLGAARNDFSSRTIIDTNTITHAGYGGGSYYGAADGYGADGIHVRGVVASTYVNGGENSGYFYNDGTSVMIVNNSVDVTADDGIQVLASGNSMIDGNTVLNAGYGEGSPYEGEGYFDGNGADGIHVRTGYIDSFYSKQLIEGVLARIVEAPRDYYLSTSTVITNNIVNTADDDGIDVEGVTNVTITNNDVDNVNDDGIEVVGFAGGLNDDFLEFGTQNIHPIFIANINNNTVDTVGDNGIVIENVDALSILNNRVTNVGSTGILVSGGNNGNVTASGNTVTNAPVGARFESGNIDISDLANPNHFINTNPLGLPVGLQFDGNPNTLTIAGETIGATTFTGFLNIGSFYVRFEDGSILDPITNEPLIINGLNAAYDGYTPPANGILTQAQLDYLEARIYDADDSIVNGRGQLFVGYVPEAVSQATLDNIEDFFNKFSSFNAGPGAASVTIAGMPRIEGLARANPSNAGGFDPNVLANIEPAAGGEDTTGVTDPNALADLEPAAGEESETTCWSDAVNAAASGKVASYTFGGSFESTMAASSNCTTASAQ